MSDVRLLTLLHLCDSLFPMGGFAHSDGLEAATDAGQVLTAGDLRAWMDVCLDDTLARAEGPAVLLAWSGFKERRWDQLVALDRDLHALRPSSTARQATRALGARLLKTWCQIHPHPDLDALLARPQPDRVIALPVVFGAVCASFDAAERAAVEGFIYTRLAATASGAMRLMRIGQLEAHGLLAATLGRVPTVVDALIARREAPAAFTPALDIALMSQQYVGSRLFLS